MDATEHNRIHNSVGSHCNCADTEIDRLRRLLEAMSAERYRLRDALDQLQKSVGRLPITDLGPHDTDLIANTCTHAYDLVSTPITANDQNPDQRCGGCGAVVIPGTPPESRVVDLMDQLEQSVQRAREARDAKR